MDRSRQPRSHLFTMRLWAEDLGDDHMEYRGKVQHVVSGEARYFRDWKTLTAFLTAKLNIVTLRKVSPKAKRK